MTFKIDLHCHSLASDGALSPTQLIERAAQQQVTDIALTDHDTTAGLEEAGNTAKQHGINLIPGIELSTSWNNKCFHIVGANINPDYAPLQEGIKNLKKIRIARAEKMAKKLAKKGIADAMEGVLKKAGQGMITRSHFADFLVAGNHVSSVQNAFDRYLAKGKPAFVSTVWTELDQTISWINDAGGVAILAHPLRYKLTASWLRRFLTAFKEMGGAGIEVVTGRSSPGEISKTAAYAQKFDLYGSIGSDFHTPNNSWVELGRLNTLPSNIKPVWELFC